MMRLVRSRERVHRTIGLQDRFSTFSGSDDVEKQFGLLVLLNELRVPPRAPLIRVQRVVSELVSYVQDGRIAVPLRDRKALLHAGEFQYLVAERFRRQPEHNASDEHPARIFQIGLRGSSPMDLSPARAQKYFTVAQRRGVLCVVATLDATDSALSLAHDASILSSCLDVGQHVVHEVGHNRAAWVHVVDGRIRLLDKTLSTGDGAGFREERIISITAVAAAEVLIVDLGELTPEHNGSGTNGRGAESAIEVVN